MYKLLSWKSYVFFLLLGLSFFSCEQLIEIIKPTHPKPITDTCRIKTENGKEYIYDLENKLVGIKDYYPEYPGPYPLIFDYNEQDQITTYELRYAPFPLSRTFSYDSLSRLHRININNDGFLSYHTFTYKKDTILIDFTSEYEGETTFHYQTVLCFKNDNLMRAYRYSQYPSETYDYTYTYTNKPNRLRDQKKKFIFLLQEFNNPLMSKHLPASSRNTAGENQSTITYTWQLNEQGYPVNNGLTNQVFYEYECEE